MRKSQVFYRRLHSYKRKKPIWKNRFFRLGILISIFLFSIFYFLFFFDTFQVKKIIANSGEKVSAENLQSCIGNRIENKIIFWRTKSIFLINTKDIKKEILNNFPQIAEVKIKRELPETITVTATERLGVAIWCQNEKCFLLDNEGIIFDSAGENQSLVEIMDKRDGIQTNLGEKVIEKEDLDKIFKISSKLKSDLKIPLREFLIVSEERLNVITAEGWEIYFTLKNDIDWQITKLNAVLEEKIPSEKEKDLEYIELRFGNFAPFKYKD